MWTYQRFVNLLHSALLLGALLLLLSALGWVVGGIQGLIVALLGCVVLVIVNGMFSPWLTLRLYGARRLTPGDAPELGRVMSILAKRAKLSTSPALYLLRSDLMNAFTVGSGPGAALTISDTLVRRLTPRELIGVLAHEIGHIANGDTWVMGLADLMSRLTSAFSLMGQVLLIMNLPLILLTEHTISWTAIALLLIAPTLAGLIQLALSRTREYSADLRAAALTGDPRGLASALVEMERRQGRMFEQIVFPGHGIPDPSLLRTHPRTEERVRRLLELDPSTLPSAPLIQSERVETDGARSSGRKHRMSRTGLWY